MLETLEMVKLADCKTHKSSVRKAATQMRPRNECDRGGVCEQSGVTPTSSREDRRSNRLSRARETRAQRSARRRYPTGYDIARIRPVTGPRTIQRGAEQLHPLGC